MEWLVLALVATVVAVFVALPRRGDADPPPAGVDDLIEERQAILDELREVEEDALAGRISGDDRAEARRALGLRLRAVTEALRDLGVEAGEAPSRGRRP